ncbi:MAG TPA: tetratricopeptide repeat protein [Drouetiella sp.]
MTKFRLPALFIVYAMTLSLANARGMTSETEHKVAPADKRANADASVRSAPPTNSSAKGLSSKMSPKTLEQAYKSYDQALYGTTLNLIEKSCTSDYAASLLQAKTAESIDCFVAAYFTRTGDLAPDKSTAAMWRGYALFASRKYTQAQVELENAIRINPKNALAHAFLGCTLCFLDEVDKGISEIKKAQSLDPTPGAYDEWMAVGYAGAGESKKAEASYDSVIARNPNIARLYLMRADFLDQAGKFPASKADYDHAIKLSPQSQYAYFRRARLLVEKKMYAQAIPDAIKGMDLEKVEQYGSKSRRLLAICYEKTGQTQKAIDTWKPFVAHCAHDQFLSGTDKLALFSLIEDCEKLHDLKSARTYVDWVCRFEKRGTEGIAKRAKIAFELGDNSTALHDYCTLISADSTNPQWFAERAKVYEKLGKPEQAKSDLVRAKALNDD